VGLNMTNIKAGKCIVHSADMVSSFIAHAAAQTCTKPMQQTLKAEQGHP
jgi:hypothetical protein